MKIINDLKPVEGPFLSIEEAEYVDGYRLRLFFDDGTIQVVDFHNYLRDAPRPWITKYWDLEEFKNFRLVDGDLMWGDFDLIFPIGDLYNGKIEYDFSRKPAIPKQSEIQNGKSEPVSVPGPMFRRLKALAKKEDVPVELLVQRYIEKGMGQHLKLN